MVSMGRLKVAPVQSAVLVAVGQRWRIQTRLCLVSGSRRESAGLGASEFPLQNLLTAGLRVSVVRLACDFDLWVVPSSGRGREVHGCTAVRTYTEGSAADSITIFGVVPHLVVLVLLEFGHLPNLQRHLEVLSILLNLDLPASIGGQRRSGERHTSRGVAEDCTENADAQDHDNHQRGRRDPEPPSAAGAGWHLTPHLRQHTVLQLCRRLIGG